MNASRLTRVLQALAAVMLFSLIMGCAAPTSTDVVSQIPTPTPTLDIVPYLSATPRPTQTQIAPPRSTVELLPSPTPFVHEIAQGDTLLAIAIRYGVQVDAILAANPGIDPRILSIGTEIVIPLGEDGQTVLPTTAPLPVTLGEPECLPTLAGDLWCFVTAQNSLDQPVESVTAQVTLFDQMGEPVASVSASAPLDLIPPQGELPLLAYFTGPLPDNLVPAARLDTAFAVRDLEERYLVVSMQIQSIEISENGLSANISGTLRLQGDRGPAGELRVAAIAYAGNGSVVGTRLWENLDGLSSGQRRAFDLLVYTLGEKIERVEVFSEARP